MQDLTETGEMSASELEPGGDWYSAAESLKNAAQVITDLVAGTYTDGIVHPFDQYQGPYIRILLGGRYAKLWLSGESLWVFTLECFKDPITGSAQEIADAIKEHLEELPSTEAPTPEQFESVVDDLLKGAPQGVQRTGKQALRGPQ